MKTTPGHRTDQQLEAILDETRDWVLNGHQERVLGFAASLRHAINRYSEYGSPGAVMTSLHHLSSGDIVVFPDQVGRLRWTTMRRGVPRAAA